MTDTNKLKPLLKKLNLIRGEIKLNKEQAKKYKAFTIAKINAELNPLLLKHNIAVSFSVGETQLESVTTKTGADNYGTNFERKINAVNGMIGYAIHDLDSDAVLQLTAPFIGMNEEGDPSRSCGNAYSYSYKYLWLTLLGITEEETDVDSPYSQQKQDQSTKSTKKPEPNKDQRDALKASLANAKTGQEINTLVNDFKAKYELTAAFSVALDKVVNAELERVK